MANKSQSTRNFMRGGGVSGAAQGNAPPSKLLRALKSRAAKQQLAELPGQAKTLIAKLARKSS